MSKRSDVPKAIRDFIAEFPAFSPDSEEPGLPPAERATVRRLLEDPRMKGAWSEVERFARSDKDFVDVFLAALTANADFGDLREQRRLAKHYAGRIATHASNLERALRHFAFRKVDGPPEFHSMRALLWSARSPDAEWEESREVLCDVMSPPYESSGERSMPRELVTAWNAAPGVADCIQALKEAAQTYSPASASFITAATARRKHSEVRDYVRALASRLADIGPAPTDPMLNVIAILAAVVLDRGDIDAEVVGKTLEKKRTKTTD